MSHLSNLMESCLRTVFSTSSDLLLLLDEKLRIIAGTEALLRQWFPACRTIPLQGIGLSAALGEAVSEFWLLRTEQAMEKVLQTGEANHYNDDVLLTDGNTMFLQVGMESLTGQNSERGLLLSLRDTTDLLQIQRREDLAKVSQTTFLTNMTYAIRTPMNHIMGISHLLSTSQQLDAAGRNYVSHLMRSANTLMDTLTNILRYSNTGEPDFDIGEDPYLLSTLFEDVSAFAQMRAEDENIAFITDIDPDLPAELIGDEPHVKQVVMNLIAASIQHTARGYVKLSASQIRMGNSIDFIIKVSDTGAGMEKEELSRLFTSPTETLSLKPDGFGSGLPLAQSLARAMEGDIEVDSHPGKGTVFTFTVPQIVSESTPYATLSRPEKRLVLLYGESLAVDSLETMLIRLSVPYRRVNKNTLPAVMNHPGRYTHILYQHKEGNDVFPTLKPIFRAAPFFKCLVITGISESDLPRETSHLRILSEPLLISHLADALIDDPAEREREEKKEKLSRAGSFVLRDVHALVVDDSEINTIVASEILRQLGAEVDTALSGQETLRLCAKREYDIIFMDHLMPEMDGIETTARIREMGNRWATVPIVALTANVVVGVRQLYLSAGMDGFIPKPIEIPLLHEVLREFLPPEKLNEAETNQARENTSRALSKALEGIQKLNAEESIVKTGSETYLAILRTFVQVTPDKTKRLQSYAASGQWERFRIEAHGQKSSLFNIGAPELSAEARTLEHLAAAGDYKGVTAQLDPFIRQLQVLCKGIKKALDTMQSETDTEVEAATKEDKAGLDAVLWRIAGHLGYLDLESVDAELTPLLTRNYSKRINVGLKSLREAIDAFDYNTANEILKDLREIENKES